MIRLATAHSKIRFSRKIEKEDVEVARQLMLRIIDQSRTVEGIAVPDEDDDYDGHVNEPPLEPASLPSGQR
jgi:DNA replicative helicase MCM subunit Mcm2 (Cdc46/Mcm family)